MHISYRRSERLSPSSNPIICYEPMAIYITNKLLITCNNNYLPFEHQVRFLMNIFSGSKAICLFSHKNISCVVSFTHEQNIICSQTQLDNIAHEQTIICRQLFAGHVVGFQPMKRKKNLQQMIIIIITCIAIIFVSTFHTPSTRVLSTCRFRSSKNKLSG